MASYISLKILASSLPKECKIRITPLSSEKVSALLSCNSWISLIPPYLREVRLLEKYFNLSLPENSRKVKDVEIKKGDKVIVIETLNLPKVHWPRDYTKEEVENARIEFLLIEFL